jgi:hypothetical protein
VSFGTKPVVSVLPVYTPRRTSEKHLFVDAQAQLCGWIVFGCMFSSGDSSSSAATTNQQLLATVANAAKQTWSAALKEPKLAPSIGWTIDSKDPAPETDHAASASVAASSSSSSAQIHLALGKIQGVSQLVDDSFATGSSIRLEAHVGGCCGANSRSVPLEQVNNNGMRSCAWARSDMIASYINVPNLSPVVHFYLVSSAVNTADNGSNATDYVFGESVVVLPLADLRLGVPLNTRVSFRDTSGNRLLLVSIGFQTTSIDASGNAAGSVTVTSNEYRNSAETSDANTRVKLTVIDGSIIDLTWRATLEPFFEINLIPPAGAVNSNSSPSNNGATGQPHFADPIISSRTRFLNFSNNKEQWNVEQTVGFFVERNPKNALEESQSPAWSILLVCRDAARYMCAEIGWAKISLPWSLLVRGRVVDQWVTFSPARSAGKNVGGFSKSAGRIRVRISKVEGASAIPGPVTLPTIGATGEPRLIQPGIGTVVMWLKGVFEPGPGNMQDRRTISLATASATVVNDRKARGQAGDSSEERSVYSEVAITTDAPLEKLYGQSNNHGDSNPEDGIFCHWASLPVSNGRSTEILLKVGVEGNIVPYVSSFAVLQGINAYSDSADFQPNIPQLQLLLHDAQAGSETQLVSTATRKTKKPPILKVDAVFVPFVSGSLVIGFGGIHMTSWANNRFAGWHGGSRRAALRYVVGNCTYGFSHEFLMGAKSPAHGAGGTGYNNRDNVVALPVNTLLENLRGENGCSFELQVYLLDLDCQDNGYCVGVGSVHTAALYYLAMRAAASSNIPKSGTASISVGLSPWLKSEVQLVDPIMGQIVAIASVSLQFVFDGVCKPSLQLLSAATGSCLQDPEAKARTEMGLKQTFMLADADKSGSVSQMEVCLMSQ